MKIDRKSIVADILKANKKTADVFRQYNLECLGCKGGEQETVEKAAINHGIPVDTLVMELNRASGNE